MAGEGEARAEAEAGGGGGACARPLPPEAFNAFTPTVGDSCSLIPGLKVVPITSSCCGMGRAPSAKSEEPGGVEGDGRASPAAACAEGGEGRRSSSPTAPPVRHQIGDLARRDAVHSIRLLDRATHERRRPAPRLLVRRRVLEAWREAGSSGTTAFDAACREGFGGAGRAGAGGRAAMPGPATPEGALALLSCSDQFPRNLFRGTAEAFASDAHARRIARGRGAARPLRPGADPTQRGFLYLPFEHSEDAADQDLSVALFEGLRDVKLHAEPEGTIDYAWRHWHVIRRFGRYPHRNAALGRASTAAEEAWLAAGGGF
jgi:uncharacterized protein (DUF924 family)